MRQAEPFPDYTNARACAKAFEDVFAWYKANHVSGSRRGRTPMAGAAPDKRPSQLAKSKGTKHGLSNTFTPEVCCKFINLLKTGSYVETVASACGIGVMTVNGWLSKGADPSLSVYESPYRAFNVAVEQAVAMVEIMHTNNVNQAAVRGEKGVEHSKWMLKNRYSRRWMGSEHVDVTSDGKALAAPVFAETLFKIVDATTASKAKK